MEEIEKKWRRTGGQMCPTYCSSLETDLSCPLGPTSDLSRPCCLRRWNDPGHLQHSMLHHISCAQQTMGTNPMCTSKRASTLAAMHPPCITKLLSSSIVPDFRDLLAEIRRPAHGELAPGGRAPGPGTGRSGHLPLAHPGIGRRLEASDILVIVSSQLHASHPNRPHKENCSRRTTL